MWGSQVTKQENIIHFMICCLPEKARTIQIKYGTNIPKLFTYSYVLIQIQWSHVIVDFLILRDKIPK